MAIVTLYRLGDPLFLYTAAAPDHTATRGTAAARTNGGGGVTPTASGERRCGVPQRTGRTIRRRWCPMAGSGD